MKNILFTTILFLIISLVTNAQSNNKSSLQTNVKPIQNPITNLQQLEPRTFEYDAANRKKLNLNSGVQYGFDIEKFQKVFPNLVKEKKVTYQFGKNAYRSTKVKEIDEAGLIPILVASIQQQQEEIEYLKMQILEIKKETAKK
ncbi:MAG: tail fiber domain-containing protein [Niabella sp.]